MLNHPFGIYNFNIKSYNSDQNGKLTLQSLFHFLQECAWDNARLNGFGFEYLLKENAFWVLSRLIVQLEHYPEWKDEIEIKTWPKGTDGLFALRDFEIYSNGKSIGKATSAWLILNRDSKRPEKPEKFNFTHENFIQEDAIERRPGKIVFKSDLEEMEKRKVYFSDLDVNKHVNNATYVRWILDSYFSNEKQAEISEFEINFMSELLLHDEFTIHKTLDDKECGYVLKNMNNKEVCRAKII